jgi:hypothetical protein
MKLKIFFILITVSFFNIFAQVNSGYTRFGIGDVQYTYSARRLGMGGISTSIADDDFINVNNPAALYKLTLTRFEVAIKYGGERLSSNSLNKFYGNAVFNGFTFGFPVSSLYGIGAAIGIIPVTSIRYNIEDNIQSSANLPEHNILYSGSGGLSKIFIGSSYRTPFDLNIGASFDYYFANLNYNTIINFTDNNSYNAVYLRKYNPNGIGTTVGIQSPDLSSFLSSENMTEFRIGAAINYISDLNTDTMLVGSSAYGTDTLGQGTVTMKVPLKISAGLSLILGNNYLVGIDYIYQPWSKYSLNGVKSSNLRNSSKISAGFEYRPSRESDNSFWEQFLLRAGLSFENTQYKIKGEGINQFAVSGGFSIPVSFENTIDIGLEYAIRGTKSSGLYKENIYKINVGISLGDLWFIRRER